MNIKKNHLTLPLWTIGLIFIGSVLGLLTKSEISTWYSTLNRSPLTPPDYIFSVVWTILYTIIGICGWIIFKSPSFPHLRLIKSLYIIQLILNWSWTPLFFHYHLTGLSLFIVGVMDILVSMIIYVTYPTIRSVSLLMMPYLLWILCASYLNLYIWQHN